MAQSGEESYPESSDDILTKALGTPEHGGRVRGHPLGTTKKSVFGKTKRAARSSNAEIMAQLQAQAEMIRQLQAVVMAGSYFIIYFSIIIY